MRKIVTHFSLSVLSILCTAAVSKAQVLDSSAWWTWFTGNAMYNASMAHPTFGGPGAEAAANTPAYRSGAASWTDSAGMLWMFGGAHTGSNKMNDVWRYNPATGHWAYYNGRMGTTMANWGNGQGSYGTLGTAAASVNPGARAGSFHWQDTAGYFWVFGGFGRDESGPAEGYLNDLWKYDIKGTTIGVNNRKWWSWMGGPKIRNEAGTYGVRGEGSVSNLPGARGGMDGRGAVWVDSANRVWLFGGFGYGRTAGVAGPLNDLWMYEPATGKWTWMNGSDEVSWWGSSGNYGVRGIAAPSNYPPSRYAPSYWKSPDGMYWMFGGMTRDEHGGIYYLNDLWRLDPRTGEWTWMSGEDQPDQPGVYNTRGVAEPVGGPGARRYGAMWTDLNGNLWLFGGFGIAAAAPANRLNDLWMYDTHTGQWTWMRGPATADNTSVGGTKGTPRADITPGGAFAFASFTDKAGNFWLYGGRGNQAFANKDEPIDALYRLAPRNPVPPRPGVYTEAGADACAGGSYRYTIPEVPGAVSYSWEYSGTGGAFANGSSTSGTTNELNLLPSAQTGLFRVRVRAVNANGAGLYRETDVEVHPAPVVSVLPAGNQSVCSGDSIEMNASAGTARAGFIWEQQPSGIRHEGAVWKTGAGGTFHVFVTDSSSGCTATSAPFDIVVNPLPLADITPAGSVQICQGDSTELHAQWGADLEYQWTADGAAAGADTNRLTILVPASYGLRVTDIVTGCAAVSAAEVDVVLGNTPVAALSVPGGGLVLCDGDSIRLEAPAGSDLTYVWLSGQTVVPGSDYFMHATRAGDYAVRVTDIRSGCHDTSAAVSLSLNPAPVLTVSPALPGGTADICEGDTLRLSVTSTQAVSYQWRENGVDVQTGAGFAVYRSGTVTVEGTDADGCRGSATPLEITVHNRPQIVLAPADTIFCEGGYITFNADLTVPGPADYIWKKDGVVIPQALSDFLEVSSTGKYSVHVARSGVQGCADSAESEVTVLPLPEAELSWDGTRLFTRAGYAEYRWYLDGRHIENAAGAEYVPEENGMYEVHVSDTNGCMKVSNAYNVRSIRTEIAGTERYADFRIYPNPVREVVFTDAVMPLHMRMLTADGKFVTAQYNTRELKVAHLPEGVYILLLEDPETGHVRYERIIKVN